MPPRIICHMIMSLDGRIVTDRWSPPATGNGTTQLNHYEKCATQFKADAWLIGRKTMGRHYAKGSPKNIKNPPRFPRKTYKGKTLGRSLAVVVDPHGKLHYGKDAIDGSHIVAILSTKVSDSYLAELQKDGVSYLFAGPDGKNMKRAMTTLRKDFDVHTLLLEGGGITNGLFLKQQLIDEISLLIYPGIDGLSGISTVFDCPGSDKSRPAKGTSLVMKATKSLSGGVVWLRYKVVRAAKGVAVT